MNPPSEPIQPARHGTTLHIKVIPRASRTECAGIQNNSLRIRIAAPPVKNAANQALIQFLAKTLACPKNAVQILQGTNGRQKTLLIQNLDVHTVKSRLQPHFPGSIPHT